MLSKIKAFFNNKIVKTVEFALIALCCFGLAYAGVEADEIAKVPALVVAILSGVSALIAYIKSLVS